MNTTEATAVSDSTSKSVDGLGLSRCAYDHAQSLTEEILMRSEVALCEHFAACREQEKQFFGVSSEYHLEVKHLGESQGGFEVIRILAGSAPIPQVVERFGRQRRHLGKPIQTRFWMRVFELTIGNEIGGSLRFSRQNEHGWQKVSETKLASDPDDLNDWLSKQLSVVSRHASGRSISQGVPR